MLDRLLTARVLVPLGLLWAACLTVAAIQGQGESGSGLGGFVADLPWHTFLLLSLVFVVLAVVALVRRLAGRSGSATV
jgi:hypothetical protein